MEGSEGGSAGREGGWKEEVVQRPRREDGRDEKRKR